jgi:translation initiation factor 3 subunit A
MRKHTLKFSIMAAALVALSLPAVAAAQWDRGSRQDRYPDNRGGYGRYDDRAVRDSAHQLDRLAKDFEREMDRALDRSRSNGTSREDRINEEVHQFRRAASDFKSRVGNGRDLNRSADEARRVLQEAQQVDRVARPRWYDNRLSSQWSAIQRELRFISDVYGFRYDGGGFGRNDDYRRDDDYRRNDDYRRRDDRNRNNNNNDWWRRIPFPQ